MPDRHQPTCPFRRAAIVAALLVLGIECGSVGDPRPPLLNLPRPVQDLAARQVGDEIRVTWRWPGTTTEGMIARSIGDFSLWAVDVPGFSESLRSETIDGYRRPLMTLAGDELADKEPGNALDVRLPLTDWQIGQTSVLVVTASNRSGRHAGYSNQVRIHPLEPPGTTEWGEITVNADGVELRWQPTERAEEYGIERSEGEDESFRSLGRLGITSFLDRAVQWGQTYRYRVRPQRRSEAGWIEGPVSAAVTVTPVDTFAPSAPVELRAVRSAKAVELSWLPSPEQDVAGYRVLRDGKAVSPLVAGTTYSDTSAPAGPVLDYAVTAVDGNQNESIPSARVAVPAASGRIESP